MEHYDTIRCAEKTLKFTRDEGSLKHTSGFKHLDGVLKTPCLHIRRQFDLFLITCVHFCLDQPETPVPS